MVVDIAKMERYVGPINPSLYPQLTVLLLGIGLFFMAWFFVYEVYSSLFSKITEVCDLAKGWKSRR
uniref:Dolichyl-diphosphooligosaccharide-protein glycosyltransferase subunit TMEM258 n=1 Tax=Ascaris lumbricoides TaxID=6252 RepID=A0A0M3IXI9_ASCLU